MKDKTFIFIICGFMFLLMIAAPFIFILSKAEVIRTENLGNVITAEKVYDSDSLFGTQLNAIENAKATITDIYINYLPGYSIIVSEIGTLKVNINKPVYSMYSEITAKAASNVASSLPADIDTVSDGDADTESTVESSDAGSESLDSLVTTEPAEQTAAAAPALEGVPVVPKIAKYSSSFLKNGVYAIDVEYEDGTKTGLLTLTNTDSPDRIRARVQSQVKEINRLAAANTDVNFYVYVCSRLQDGENFSQYVPGVQSLKPYVDEFFDSLDSRIKYDKLKVNTLEDSIQKLFLTDHHWNAYGAYEAYCEIVNMVSADSPSIGSPRPLGKLHTIDGAVFYGSNARTYGYYGYTDTFFFYDYELPEHEIETTQRYRGFQSNMSRYLSGDYSKSRDTDHYVDFYPYTAYTKYPENNTGRKLLMLADSYSRGISELIGSAFDEAYIFDFRRINEIGDYNTFIEKYGITDVLIMQYSLRGVFDDQRDNTLDTIRTK